MKQIFLAALVLGCLSFMSFFAVKQSEPALCDFQPQAGKTYYSDSAAKPALFLTRLSPFCFAEMREEQGAWSPAVAHQIRERAYSAYLRLRLIFTVGGCFFISLLVLMLLDAKRRKEAEQISNGKKNVDDDCAKQC